jgi:hypothetical protein
MMAGCLVTRSELWEEPEKSMEPAYLTAFAALAGSVIGGLTSLAASWVAQRVHANAQQRAHDVGVREDLYKAFIDEASKSYADALERTEVDPANIVRLYALVSRMRVLSSQRIVEQANGVVRLIMDTYGAPNRTLREEAERMKTGGLDPLLGFSEACRDELRKPRAVGAGQ